MLRARSMSARGRFCLIWSGMHHAVARFSVVAPGFIDHRNMRGDLLSFTSHRRLATNHRVYRPFWLEVETVCVLSIGTSRPTSALALRLVWPPPDLAAASVA